MNKTKRVAWKKRRIRQKKLKAKAKEQSER